MTEGQAMQLVWAVFAIILVSSALTARRLGLGAAMRMIGGWVVIFGVAIVVASYRTELGIAWNRLVGDVSGARAQVVGGELRLPLQPDGHFWIDARVNGVTTRFLVDTGASFTAVSPATVRDAGLTVDETGLPVLIQTANGQVAARRTRLAELEAGPIRAVNIAAITSPAFGGFNVVGMNFLSRLVSWRVEGGTMILVPERAEDAQTDSELT